jgi:hypothetical protein
MGFESVQSWNGTRISDTSRLIGNQPTMITQLRRLRARHREAMELAGLQLVVNEDAVGNVPGRTMKSPSGRLARGPGPDDGFSFAGPLHAPYSAAIGCWRIAGNRVGSAHARGGIVPGNPPRSGARGPGTESASPSARTVRSRTPPTDRDPVNQARTPFPAPADACRGDFFRGGMARPRG